MTEFVDSGCPAYDAGSNRTSATLDGTTVSYAYDTLNRLSNLTSGFAGQFTFGYDALSRRTSLNRPNSVNTTYTYDSVSRLLSVLHQLGTTTIDGASYGVDPAGNRVSKTNYIDGSNESYSYDALYQLTQVLHNGSTSESYTYDGVGNRLSSLGVPSYTVNNSNQLTSTSNATFTYDSNGNTISKTDGSGTTNYAWDFENRLVSVALPGTGGTVTFKYDPSGRRIQKSSSSGTINFAYDGANVVEELNAAGTATAQYAQGAGIDEPLATNRGGTLAFYEADGLDSVTSLTDGTGSALGAYTTDAFGKPVSSADSTVHNPFRYTGREYDAETGLYYYRARYYDPNTGRFLSEDLAAFGGGIDFYRYVSNSPVDEVDPLGLADINFNIDTKNHGWGPFANGETWFNGAGDPPGVYVMCKPMGKGKCRMSASVTWDIHILYGTQAQLKEEKEHARIFIDYMNSRKSYYEQQYESTVYSSEEACEKVRWAVEDAFRRTLMHDLHEANLRERKAENWFSDLWDWLTNALSK